MDTISFAVEADCWYYSVDLMVFIRMQLRKMLLIVYIYTHTHTYIYTYIYNSSFYLKWIINLSFEIVYTYKVAIITDQCYLNHV